MCGMLIEIQYNALNFNLSLGGYENVYKMGV